jgi:hypothetical protein
MTLFHVFERIYLLEMRENATVLSQQRCLYVSFRCSL